MDVFLPQPLTSSAVEAERVRAHYKHMNSPTGSMEMKPWTDPSWLAVIMEELGEAAHELNEWQRSGHSSENISQDERQLRLCKELIQTAAMVCAWIEAIDTNRV